MELDILLACGKMIADVQACISAIIEQQHKSVEYSRLCSQRFEARGKLRLRIFDGNGYNDRCRIHSNYLIGRKSAFNCMTGRIGEA